MARPSAFKSTLRALAAPLVALALVALLWLAGVTERIDRAWFDLLQRELADQAPIPEDTAIVLIDEQSLQAMGSENYGMRWPWPRSAFAGLFAGLHRAGARRIVVDLIFFENSVNEEDDLLLRGVAAGLTEVTLGASRNPRNGIIQLPVIWPPPFRLEQERYFAGRSRWGYVNSLPDADGVIRRYLRGESLVEAALQRPPDGQPPVPELLRWRGNLADLRRRGVPVLAAYPFVQAGLGMLGDGTVFHPAELTALIDAAPEPEGEHFRAVRGRTVFVGANAKAAFDAVATPCASPDPDGVQVEPGVITHWTAYANFASGDFLTDSGWRASLAALALCVVLVGAYGRKGVGLLAPGLAAGLPAALLVGGSAVFFNFGVWFAPALPVLGSAAAFSAVAVQSFRLERARKREIQGWFGTYVSPAVVKRLVQDPDSLKLGGERRELTVFFSDLAGFTTLSEKMSPDRLVTLVNTFLEHLTECVLEQGCYLDKYIGDSIMAVFGSPEELDNHALAACRAALESQRCLNRLNDQLERDHGVRLGMRIGINTGDMIVGNVGSTKKRNYTVLGDAVNLASRLEGANKEFGTAILLGPLTAARVADAMLTRPVGLLRVKGKEQAVAVHELVGELDRANETDHQFVSSFVEGYEAFCARRFGRAVRAMEEAAYLRPDDALTTRYLSEARRWANSPPPADWEPILKLETK
ncbi:MAG: adenylate/guanylate cyclase domain-containing protein [Opitutaceae bacterium]|nr:adenylate/guanylate cyclase domain-containing protein [Opitutaceae bacterium]